MRTTLQQERTLNALAHFLYDFLPGKPFPFADRSVSFPGVAASLGLSDFWPDGSKEPAIRTLLRRTFEQRQSQFCPLVLEVVRRGMGYRESKGKPLTQEEVGKLNELLAGLGFKIPELVDAKFRDSLPSASASASPLPKQQQIDQLTGQLLELSKLGHQPRGYGFERFLNDLFDVFGLAPRKPFRLVGEQIDGSFEFDKETYLLEATWTNRQAGEEELLAFYGKVLGKAEWSRGMHVSYAGYTGPGLEAFMRGKRTNFICMDGLDLHDLLSREIALDAVLRAKTRRAAETNEAFVRVRELFG